MNEEELIRYLEEKWNDPETHKAFQAGTNMSNPVSWTYRRFFNSWVKSRLKGYDGAGI